MLRILFTGDDVARTRIAARPDPLWELVMAVHMLRPQRGDLLFTGWRREVTSALRRAGLGRSLRLLLTLAPNVGYFPDFLNPIDAAQGLEPGLEAIRSTPKSLLRRDMRQLARWRPLSRDAEGVALGDSATLGQLTDAMRTCYDRIVAPYQRNIDTALDRDRAARVNALAGGGVEGLLRGLQPLATWNSGELRVPTHRDQELHLDGRGLLLIPSYFCVSGPLTLFDHDLPPVLIYPVERQQDVLPGRERATSVALATLLGTTRAAVMDAVGARQTSTSELALQAGISPASASEHATVLRQAGLVTSHRERNRVMHHLTPLGLALLDANRTRP